MRLKDIIRAGYLEDIPQGDVTTDSLGLGPRLGVATLICKQDLFLSGKMAFEESIRYLEPSATLNWNFEDGAEIKSFSEVCTIKGDLLQILKSERVALNFLGRLSGIATHASKFAGAVKHTNTKILDTRKTIPAYRSLEKQAVLDGGACNHRFSLSSAVLIKENHINLGGGIENTIKRIRTYSSLPIEVEVRDLDELKQAIELKPARIMLDNFTNPQLKEAIKLMPSDIESEASGNMTLDRVGSVADIGVDFISVGAITHSAPNADFSLLFDWENVQK